MGIKTLFLSSGHGGSDPGACANGLNERDWTQQFVDRIQYTINTYFKCSELKCIRVPNGPDANSDVNGAVDFVNANYSPNEYTLAIDYHLNAATPTEKGWELFCYCGDYQSKHFANILSNQLHRVNNHFQIPFRGIKDGSQFGFVGRTNPISFLL